MMMSIMMIVEYLNGARSICLNRDISSGDNVVTNLQCTELK